MSNFFSKAGMRRFKHNMLTTFNLAEKSQDKDFDATVERFYTIQRLLEQLYTNLDSYFNKLTEQVEASVSVSEHFRQLGTTANDDISAPGELRLLMGHFVDSQSSTSRTILEPAKSFYKKEILTPVEDAIKGLHPVKKQIQDCKGLLTDVAVFKLKYSNSKKKDKDGKKSLQLRDKLQSHESNLQKAKTSLYQRIGELVEQVPFLIKSQLESLVAFQVHFHSRCHDHLKPALDSLPGAAINMVQLAGLTGHARDTEGLYAGDKKGISNDLKTYYLEVQLHNRNGGQIRLDKHGLEKPVVSMGTSFQMAHTAASPPGASAHATVKRTPTQTHLRKRSKDPAQAKRQSSSVPRRRGSSVEEHASAPPATVDSTTMEPKSKAQIPPQDQDKEDNKESVPAAPPSPPRPKRHVVIALYDYPGKDKDELSMRCGENIRVLKKDNSGWWYGENSSGGKGFFPKSYTNAKD